MTEKFNSQSYEERESSKIGLNDYIRQTAIWVIAPIAASVGGFFAARALKNVIKNPSIQTKLENAGMSLGIPIIGYHAWHENTARQAEVGDIVQQAQILKDMESPNAYLEKENAQLRRQLEFTTLHPSRAAKGSHTERLQQESVQNDLLQR